MTILIYMISFSLNQINLITFGYSVSLHHFNDLWNKTRLKRSCTEPPPISLYPVKFSRHKSCEKGDLQAMIAFNLYRNFTKPLHGRVMRIYGTELLTVCHPPDKFWGATTWLKGYVNLWVEAQHGKSPHCHVCWTWV